MKYILQTFAMVTLLPACSLDIPLEDKVTDPWAIVDAESALKALSTVYSGYEHWKSMVPITAMSDDCVPTADLPKDIRLRNAYYWNKVELAELADNFWKEQYAAIMYANAITERIPLIKNAGEQDSKVLSIIVKEANALKALCYFQLMQLFAPRYLSGEADRQPGVVYKKHVKLEYNPRMSLQATADTIRELLAPYMDEEKPLTLSTFRLSPLGARCLAAELEMWTGNYEKVVALCEPVVEKYNMDAVSTDLYEKFWAQASTPESESIFNIDYAAFRGANFYDNWILNNRDLLVINNTIKYEESDIRLSSSIVPLEIYVATVMHRVFRLGKYNTLRDQSRSIRYVSIYRMADFVFLCAEGYARSGKPEKARALMNRYLKSRKVTVISNDVQGEALINRILTEKQKEFLGEGKRYFDLKRLGNAKLARNLILHDPLETIQPDDFRWTFPIPVSEVRYNKIQQNRDWEFLMGGL